MTITGFSSASDMLQAMRTGEISAVELLDLHLKRIERYNPPLNAIVTPNYEQARQVAQDADGASPGALPLQGLPLTIKDCIYVKGLVTTGGLPRRAGTTDEHDAQLVAKVRSAGAGIMGKTNVPPYASDFQSNNPVFGRSNNPWDLSRTPGGSTGGGAAAVAAGLTPLEFGGDFAGSIRIPAAFCGVCGHKSSLTAVPQTGHFPSGLLPNRATGIAVLGPLARYAEDLELAMEVVAGGETGEEPAWRIELPPARQERLEGFRVGILPALGWLPVESEIVRAVDDLEARLGRAGVKTKRVAPDGCDDFSRYYKLYLRIVGAIEATGLSAEKREQRAGWCIDSGDEYIAAYGEGVGGTASDLVSWQAERERYRENYRRFFRDWDVLVTPVNIVNAFPHTDIPFSQRRFEIDDQSVYYGRQSFYPSLANLSGHPATAFPWGRTPAGLPIGLQAVGPYLEDRTPIRFVQYLAREFGGFTAPPGCEA